MHFPEVLKHSQYSKGKVAVLTLELSNGIQIIPRTQSIVEARDITLSISIVKIKECAQTTKWKTNPPQQKETEFKAVFCFVLFSVQ